MVKYRSRLKIVADMLSVVSGDDAKKTRIMYLANLSWDLLNRYLDELIEAGLVKDNHSGCYVLTRKGKLFLYRFSEYSKRCQQVDEHVNNLEKERQNLENMCFKEKEPDEK